MVTLVVSPESFGRERIEVEGDDYRHLFRALRMRLGDRLRVVDGLGKARSGRIEAIDRKRGALLLGETVSSGEAAHPLELGIATIRPERAAWAVEKATEIGVVGIHWFGCERAPRSYGTGQLDRFQRVASSAVAQCGRALVPSIDVVSWEALLERVGAEPTWVLDPEGGSPTAGERRPRFLIVGPEGGLSAEELKAFAERGASPVRVGGTILRTETAAVVGSGLVLGS